MSALECHLTVELITATPQRLIALTQLAVFNAPADLGPPQMDFLVHVSFSISIFAFEIDHFLTIHSSS